MCGLCAVYVRFMCGVCAVYVRCLCGVCAVFVLFWCGLCAVFARCLCYFGATLARCLCYFSAMFVLFWCDFSAVFHIHRTYTAQIPEKGKRRGSGRVDRDCPGLYRGFRRLRDVASTPNGEKKEDRRNQKPATAIHVDIWVSRENLLHRHRVPGEAGLAERTIVEFYVISIIRF